MDVVGSDGQHVGTVDNVGIKLTKNDSDAHNQHNYLKLESVNTVENGKLVRSIAPAEAHAKLKAVEN